jgi:aspartyl-tRNA(Asn)/glutamyl-tRNA(Gln) amidotransferase subunit C
MKITAETVSQIAALARLELSDEELARYARELDAIVAYVDQLGAVDTSGVPPTSHAMDLVAPLRPDEPEPALERRDALANAPDQDGEAFVVPRVI